MCQLFQREQKKNKEKRLKQCFNNRIQTPLVTETLSHGSSAEFKRSLQIAQQCEAVEREIERINFISRAEANFNSVNLQWVDKKKRRGHRERWADKTGAAVTRWGMQKTIVFRRNLQPRELRRCQFLLLLLSFSHRMF